MTRAAPSVPAESTSATPSADGSPPVTVTVRRWGDRDGRPSAPTADQASPESSAGPRLRRLGHRPADQVPQPVALAFPLAGGSRTLVGHRPGRPSLRARATGPRPRTGWSESAPGPGSRPRSRDPAPSTAGRSMTAVAAASRGETTARTTRRVAELITGGACAAGSAGPAASRHARRRAPRPRGSPARRSLRPPASARSSSGRADRAGWPGTTSRCSYRQTGSPPFIGLSTAVGPHRDLGRIGPEDVVPDRDGDVRRRRGHARLGARPEVDDQRVPGQPLHAHGQRGLRRRVLGLLEDRGDRHADHLSPRLTPDRRRG